MFENMRADLRAHKGHRIAQGFRALAVCRFGLWRCGVRPVFLTPTMSSAFRVPVVVECDRERAEA